MDKKILPGVFIIALRAGLSGAKVEDITYDLN